MSPPATDDATGEGSDGDAFERVDAPRGDVTREWEAFVREDAGEPLCHVGSVSAPSADVAREQAAALFGWRADAVWLCPADETVRLAAEGTALEDRAEGDADATAPAESGGERP